MKTISIKEFAEIKKVKETCVRTAARLGYINRRAVPKVGANGCAWEIIMDAKANKWVPGKRGKANGQKRSWAQRNYKHDSVGCFCLTSYWMDHNTKRLKKRT
jgi:hypothetical protein